MRTILYCRVSSDEQAKGASLEVQESYLRSYCVNHGYEVVGIYKEDYSAKHHDLRRPEFKRMYDYCRKNKKYIDKILFLRWDRFSRNIEFALTYKRKFIDEMGIEINAIESPIDFSGTEWSMLMGMYCGVAHTEDEKISRRTKECTHKKRMQGHCTNKAPRGYKNVRVDEHNTHAEIDEPKAKMVRKAFEEVAKGVETPCRIRKRLFPSVAESSFFDMLRNPFYIGKIRVPAYGSDPEMIVEGLHEGIITEELFYKVQDILNAKKKAPKLSKKINPDLFLRKFLVCPICGHALTGAESRGNGGKYAYYNCCHDAKHIRKRAEVVNEGFAKYVGSLKPNETVLKLYENILEDIRKEQISDSLAEVELLKSKMQTYKNRIQKAKDLYLDGEMGKEEKDEAVSHNQKELDELQNKVDMLEMGNRLKIKPKLDYSISLISNMERYIVDAPVETKIKLISSMFPQKIEFDGEKYRTNSYNQVLDLIGSPDKSGGEFFNSIENLYLCTMNNQGLLALAQLILPSEILSNFEVVRVEEEASLIRIYLDESVKAEYKESPEIESKGFCEAVTIRDFPIRDKGVDLIVRRRKWYDKQNNRYFSDFYDLKAEETRYSKEFAAFLKGVYGDDSYDLPFA